MNPNASPPPPNLSSLEKKPDSPFNLRIVGGSFAVVGEVPEAIAADRVSYIDTSVPMWKRRIAESVSKFLIGFRETTASVHNETGGLEKLLRKGGNFQIGDGLNCLLAAGYYAGTYTVSLPQNQQDYVADYASVRKGRGGQLLEHADCLLAGPGGASGGTGAIMQEALVSPYKLNSGILRMQRVRLGFIGHIGCRTDRRIEHNHAAALCHDLFWLLESIERKPGEAYVTRELYVLDAPNCGRDRKLRDYYHGVIAQSMLCQEMRGEFNELMCNNNINDLGRVIVLRFGFCEEISRAHVAAVANQQYRKLIEDLLGESSHAVGLGDLVVCIEDLRGPKAADFAEFLRLVQDQTTSAPALQSIAQQTEKNPQAVGEVPVAGHKSLNLRNLKKTLEACPRTFAGIKKRRTLVNSLMPKVKPQLRNAEGRVKRAERLLTAKTYWLVLVMLWGFGKGVLLSRLVSQMLPTRWKTQRLHAAFKGVRVAAYKLAAETSKLHLLRGAYAVLALEQDRIKSQLTTVLRVLRPMAIGKTIEPLVEILSIEEAWPILLQLQPSRVVENQRTLSRLVTFVNERGLKFILGARDFDVHSLAQAMKAPPAVEWGPHFGDSATRHYQLPYVVLPPISDGLRNRLSNVLGTYQFFVADSAAAGITVTLISTSTPNPIEKNGLKELFTVAVRNAFIETLQPEVRDEFYPGGDEAPKWLANLLGISFPIDVPGVPR